MTDDVRCREAKQLERIDEAFRTGDLEALRAAVDDPSVIPNGPMPMAIGPWAFMAGTSRMSGMTMRDSTRVITCW